MYTTKFNGIQWHPVAIFGTTPKQNLMGTSIFVISTVILKNTKTLTGYDELVYVKVSKQRHLKQCHICIKNVIIERMTLNDSCHKHA